MINRANLHSPQALPSSGSWLIHAAERYDNLIISEAIEGLGGGNRVDGRYNFFRDRPKDIDHASSDNSVVIVLLAA